jgi:hypothetical protein
MTTRHQLEQVQQRLDSLKSSVRHEDAPEDNWVRQDEIIGLLSVVTDTVKQSSENRSNQYAQIAHQLGTLESKVEHIIQDVGILCKLVRDGNGQPSIIQRLANLETVVNGQRKDIEECTKHANSIAASKQSTKAQTVAGFVGIVITAIISGFALFAALANK